MRIQNKLFAVLLSMSVVLVGIMLVLMQWSIDRGMLNYVNTKQVERLQPLINNAIEIYAEQESWHTLQDNPRRWIAVLRDANIQRLLPPPPPTRNNNQRKRPPKPHENIALIDMQEQLVIGRYNPNRRTNKFAISYQNETVGWLILPKREKITEGFELQFLEQQREAFLFISLILIALVIAVAFPLARHFVRPINELANSTRQLTEGDYHIALAANRNDELGQLAKDFNQLASTLASNEKNRKHWLADISHELRTPLAILKGELEAIIDGIRPANQDSLESLSQEVDHLGKLIEDLYQLSNTQIGGLRYQLETLDLLALLERQLGLHSQSMTEAGIELQLINNTNQLNIWGDSTRICQLIDNLLNNSLKYTEANGTLKITIESNHHEAIIRWEDSDPAVPDEALDKLFDHLYRVESSRNRNTGGSGLGLSICQQIVNAHQGKIKADHSELGGLLITFTLPLTR